jgi:CheY-like chemotaxis protein
MTELSKWRISAETGLTREGKINSSSHLRILFLDDHKLFRTAIIDYCIKTFYPFAEIIEVENGDIALEKAKQYITKNIPPHLIITDFNHPGLLGHQFINRLRAFERIQKRKTKIPILVVSMRPAQNITPLLGKDIAAEDIIILSKGHDGCQISEAMDMLLH